MTSKLFVNLTFVVSLLLSGCQTHIPEKKQEIVAATTSLNPQENPKSSEQLLVPSELVITAKTIRDLTELRSGPGSQFPLLDNLIEKNTLLILLAKYKKWNKVYIPSLDVSAWIHQNQLHITRNLNRNINISTLTLPLVTSYTKIDTIYDYLNKKPLNFPIPKGRGFRQLKKTILWY